MAATVLLANGCGVAYADADDTNHINDLLTRGYSVVYLIPETAEVTE